MPKNQSQGLVLLGYTEEKPQLEFLLGKPITWRKPKLEPL